MIPFRDENPSGTVPVVTVALIVVNVAAFVLLEVPKEEPQLQAFVVRYGLRPALVTGYVTGEPAARKEPLLVFLPFLTCMFLHGGWLHLIGNMWYLWIFGDNVEDRMGHAKFLLFYLLCGLGASVTHIALQPASPLPMVGASGALAGVLGAYALAFPRARVSTLVTLGFFITVLQLPALIVLGFWFALQFLSGLGSMRMAGSTGVAHWAHVGGFVLGLLLLWVFQKPREKRRAYVPYVRRRRL